MKFAALLLMGCLLVTGCASNQESSAPAVPTQTRLQTEAYVTVNLSVNGPGVGLFTQNYDALELVTSTNARYRLLKLKDSPEGYALLSGWMPPGKYRLNLLESSNQMERNRFDIEPMFREFEIKAGAVNHLGTLVYQPVGSGEATVLQMRSDSQPLQQWVSRTVFSATASAVPMNTVAMESVFPVRARKSDRSGSQGLIVELLMSATEKANRQQLQQRWSTAKTGEETSRYARESTFTLNNAMYMADGRVAFGSKLGQILWRSPAGSWTNMDVGSAQEVMSVLQDQQLVLAGMDDGSLRISRDGGGSWQARQLDSELSPVIYMARGNGTELFAVIKSRQALRVLKLASLESEPVVLREIKLASNNFWVMQPGYFRGIVTRSDMRLLFAISADSIESLDMGTGQWNVQKTPSSYTILRANNNGKTILLGDMAGITRSSQISYDYGRSWKPVSIPRMATNAFFANERFAAALVLNMGAFSSTTSINISTDGGASWSDGKALTEQCVNVAVLDASNEVICATIAGQLLTTRDGQNWKVERSVY